MKAGFSLAQKFSFYDAIDAKMRFKFTAMQQNSATLINNLNAMKGTVESYLKIWKSHLVL